MSVRTPRQKFFSRTFTPKLLVSALFLLCNFSCGGISSPDAPSEANAAATACQNGAAAIQVGDGFSRILCGCTGSSEEAGTMYSTSDNLTCHLVSSNSVVFFHYLGTVNRHQIVPTGANNFLPSAVSNPNDNSPIRVHIASFPHPGLTYGFGDAFSPIKGQIKVP